MTERCVACGSPAWSPGETVDGYQLAVCGRCCATFTLNPDYDARRYVAAYEGSPGGGAVADGHAFVYMAPAKRLEMETLAFLAPPPRLTPAQRLALQWIKGNAPPGATIVDCGCGTGLFLRALRRSRIRGVGVEVSKALVELLSRRALEAIEGRAPDFWWERDPPFAITFFEVLEHFARPSEIIGSIAKRFPKTSILVSVPSPQRAGLLLRGERSPSDLPPNHFVRWTPQALAFFFQDLGYRPVTVTLPPPSGSELLPGLGQILRRRSGPIVVQPVGSSARRGIVRRLAVTATLWVHKGYQVAADVLGAPAAWHAQTRGASAGSMLAIAEPPGLL